MMSRVKIELEHDLAILSDPMDDDAPLIPQVREFVESLSIQGTTYPAPHTSIEMS